jgi:predicted metal-dependent hydrolase
MHTHRQRPRTGVAGLGAIRRIDGVIRFKYRLRGANLGLYLPTPQQHRSEAAPVLSRKPDLHADEAPIIWSRIPEFAQYWNAASVVIPYVEHYLIAVMTEATDKIGDSQPQLRDALAIFIEQERTHSAYHLHFNKRMYEAGYAELKPLIETIKGELRALREHRSLAFNIAY